MRKRGPAEPAARLPSGRQREDVTKDVVIRSQGTRILRAMAEVLIRAEIAAGRAGRLPELLRRLVYCAVVPFRGVDEAISRSRQAEERAAVRG